MASHTVSHVLSETELPQAARSAERAQVRNSESRCVGESVANRHARKPGFVLFEAGAGVFPSIAVVRG